VDRPVVSTSAMIVHKDCALALAFILVACPNLLQALDLSEADDRVPNSTVTAERHARSSWFQVQVPDLSSWFLQKLLDDSLEFLAFGCCICWVCSHASHKFLGSDNSGELDSRVIFWELLPFFMLVLSSVMLLMIMGAGASWDVSTELVLLLPVLCMAFAVRRCPRLLQWLLCCGLFLQILHHSVEHAQSLTDVHTECGVSSSSMKKNLRMTNDHNTNLEGNVTMLTDGTIYPDHGETFQKKEIATLKATLDVQTKRIEALTAEKEKEVTYEEKDVSMLEQTVNVQAKHIQALTAEIAMLNSEKEVLNKTVEALTDRNQFLEHSRIIR